MAPVGRFQAGGALGEGALYVERAADRELLAALRAGELCYVFATTQTGKSSLKLHALAALERGGVTVVDIILAGGVTEEQWYYGLAQMISREAGLGIDVAAFWGRDENLAHVQRWAAFLQDELLPRVEGGMVICFDEVNVVGGLGFETDSFFASIRDVYDARAKDARYGALTFCLLGITFPEALMNDHARSPFRIGKAIVADDFTRAEMDALAPGLAAAGDAGGLLDEVYGWTHGHPYMTQRVCAALAGGGEGTAEERVRRAVEEVFLDASKPRDPNLRFAEKYLEREGVPTADLVFLYRRVLEGESIVFDPNSAMEQHACLSGMVAARVGEDGRPRLTARNKVFVEALGLEWVREREGEQTFGEQLRLWRAAPPEGKGVYLLKGQALEEALVRVKQRGELSPQEEAFLRASQEEAGRVARRNTWVLGAIVAVLLAAFGMAAWQFFEARDAARRERVAARREREARVDAEAKARAEQGLRVRAQARLPGHEMEALVLGIRALSTGPAKAWPAMMDGMVYGLMNAPWLLAVLEGHTMSVRSASFSPDGTWVVTASFDKTARVWDARTGKVLVTLVGHTASVWSASFSQDGMRVVTASKDETARVWDARTGKVLATLEGHKDIVRSASFSPDGTRVVTASNDKTARVWDARTGKVLATLEGHKGIVRSVSFSPDGTRAVTASDDSTARVWDARTGKVLATLEGHESAVWAVSFSPDGTRVVTASWDHTARVWDARTGNVLATLKGHWAAVMSVSFSSDGTRVVTASNDKTARVWNARTGKALTTLEGHKDSVVSASFSPDGTRVVTASWDHTAQVWDARSGKALATLKGHKDVLMSVSFSPRGTRVVTASEDMTACIWDARNGKALATLEGHKQALMSVSFSPDGTRVVARRQLHRPADDNYISPSAEA